MEYLLIEIVSFLITLSVHRYYKLKLFRSRNQSIIFWFLVIFLGALWDNFAVFRGHWLYPGEGTIGINIGLIPFEDYIFMIVVTYAILVMYQVSNKMLDNKRARKS